MAFNVMIRPEGLALGVVAAGQRCSGNTKSGRGGALRRRHVRLGARTDSGIFRGQGVGTRTNITKAQGERLTASLIFWETPLRVT
eukprot:3256841-Pyramimonas_sp.AAC.4